MNNTNTDIYCSGNEHQLSAWNTPCILVINITNFTETPTTNDHDGRPPSSKPHTELNKNQQTNRSVSNIRYPETEHTVTYSCVFDYYGSHIGYWIYWHLIAHDAELQVITAPLLISAIYKSPQYPPSIFQPVVSSPAVPWQRLLLVEILQLPAFRSFLQRLSYRTAYQQSLSGTRLTLLITFRHEPHGKHRFHFYSSEIPRLLLEYSLQRERVYRDVAWKLL
jgi:hypothetical protein